MYDLNLKLPSGKFGWKDIEESKTVKEKLESFTDFYERLAWYNQNIISLAAYERNHAQIYYEWGSPDQRIKVFCDCPTCKADAEYDTKKEKVFVELRKAEIKRITEAINESETYQEKLAFLFSVKGFHADRSPIIKDKYEDYTPLIDLCPRNNEQNKALNDFVIVEWKAEFLTNGAFNDNWKGFDFEKEKYRFLQTASKAVDKGKTLVKFIIGKIENHFNYSFENLSKKLANEVAVKDNDRQLKYFGHIPDLFAKLINGIEPDLSDVNIYSGTYSEYVHTQEIVKFYRFLHHPLEEIFTDEVEQPVFITQYDKLMRSLGIIDSIYKAQNLKRGDELADFHYVYDESGRNHIDGNYLASFDILSNVPLFSLQEYKQEFQLRFEQASNTVLVINQINSIRKKATEILSYYNSGLTKDSDILKEFLEKKKRNDLKFKEAAEQKAIEPDAERKKKIEAELDRIFDDNLYLSKQHQAVVKVQDYRLDSIYIGIDRLNIAGRLIGKTKFHYLSSNYELAIICQSVIEFASAFIAEPATPAPTQSNTVLPAFQSEVEILIGKIDNAFLDIFYAKQKGYTFFDFESNLKNLLSNPHHKIGAYKVERYLAVLNDLFTPVKHHFFKLRKIDRKKNLFIYDSFTVYSNRTGTEKGKEEIITYEPEQFKSLAASAQMGEGSTIPVDKLSEYLEGVKTQDELPIKLWALTKWYKDLFRQYGYESQTISLTFEEFISWLPQKTSESESEKKELISASHREAILAHQFKVKAGIEIEKSASQWKEERGEKAKQNYYTTLKQSKNYKETTKSELSTVIQLLKDYPEAQKMAINKLAELESL